MQPLKPCPFCGGPIRFEQSSAVYNRRVNGECMKCGMQFSYQEEYDELLGGNRVMYVPMKATFEEIWNSRIPEDSFLLKDFNINE